MPSGDGTKTGARRCWDGCTGVGGAGARAGGRPISCGGGALEGTVAGLLLVQPMMMVVDWPGRNP